MKRLLALILLISATGWLSPATFAEFPEYSFTVNNSVCFEPPFNTGKWFWHEQKRVFSQSPAGNGDVFTFWCAGVDAATPDSARAQLAYLFTGVTEPKANFIVTDSSVPLRSSFRFVWEFDAQRNRSVLGYVFPSGCLIYVLLGPGGDSAPFERYVEGCITCQ